LPADRIQVVPNFLEPDPGVVSGPRSGFLFVGRLSEEKGLPTLVRSAALVPGTIRVAGDGPLTPLVDAAGQKGALKALGRLDKAAVLAQLRGAVAMVLPSVWFEGLPVSVLEAYATGTPVVGSRIGSLAELIRDGVTGLLVTPGDAGDLAARLRWANDHPAEMLQMGLNARREYETKYRGGVHLNALLETYERLIAASGSIAHA